MQQIDKFFFATAVALIAAPAHSTNGYFSHGYGTQNQAMAGAGIALALDALAPASNPAAIAFTDDRTEAGLAAFSPRRSYTTRGTPTGACASASQCTFGIGPQKIDSGAEWFLIPHFGMVRKIGPAAFWGLAIYANGGMNTRYQGGSATFGVPMGSVPPGTSVTAPGTYGAGTAGVDLTQLFIAPTYSRRISSDAAWGVTPIFAYQQFEARGLANFAPFSSDPQRLTDNGHDDSYGAGMRVGIQAQLATHLRLGAAYQSRIYMSRFKDYAGLFAERGDFDIPSNMALGLAWEAMPTLTLALDAQYIRFSEVKSVGNPMLPNLAMNQLGSNSGAGFGWDDMTIYKLGARWRSSSAWTWMAGYSFGQQPIPDNEVLFNILAPGVIEQHITLGFVQKLNQHEFSVALMYAPSESVAGTNPLDPAQSIEFEMSQFELDFNWLF